MKLQGVSDAINEVEERAYVESVDDGLVANAGGANTLHVFRPYLIGDESHPL